MDKSDKMETIKYDDEISVVKLLPKVQTINIDFYNISYTVHKTGKARRILRGISGSFKSGELTAVLGPSGAGKTTLLNLLAGYSVQIDGNGGNVLINNSPRHPKHFRRLCCYIMQEALMQPHLTVLEAMMIASKLKVADFTHKARLANILDILRTLGIEECTETRTEVLSGGQKKRLSIALELVCNPSVLFLDEPTTGLDTHAGKMVMRALKTLAAQGRTVICTVHQPSPLEFRAYDNVYFVAEGACVYAGPPSNLVPFLRDTENPCPVTHSPADYIIELVQMHPEVVDLLALAVKTEQNQKKLSNQSLVVEKFDEVEYGQQSSVPSNLTKLKVLFSRMMLQRWRNKETLFIQLLHHTLSSLLVGLTFYGIGNEASEIIQNVKLAMVLCVFCVYTYVMVSILYFPLEVELVKREYFNNWYGALTYYISYSLSTIPAMLPNTVLFTLIIYFLSAQPMELERILYVTSLSFITSYCSEGLGLFIGSLGSIKSGCILGPAVIGPLFALSVYGAGYGEYIEPSMDFLMKLTFLRYILAAYWISLFGLSRKPLECNALYCHWKDSSTILRDLGVRGMSPWHAIGALLAYTVLHRILGYIAIRYRLHAELPRSSRSSRIIGVAGKVISHFRNQRN